MNNNYRLQLRHGDEARNFVTRNDVFRHINGQLQYGGVSLLPYEPVLFYYGEEDNKNAIIMVGLPEGDKHKGKSYFIIDTADLKEQINTIDGKYDTAIEALQEEDGKLWNVINKEVEDRISADETEAQVRSEKDAELEKTIADEVEARTKADESLQSAIDHTKDDLMSVVEACGLIYNDKLAEDRVSYEPDTHDEIIRDSNDIADAVDKISKFAQKMAKDLNIKVANTDTVKLNLEVDERIGGGTITADVKIAGSEGLSKKAYDNNIIGKTADGVYASVSLEPSATNPNKLIFTTSGYVNGVFQVDAFETEFDLTAYKGDNGKNTGVTVNVDTTENKISAQLNLSSSNNNILKLEDGVYSVEGTSKNITYKDGTVFSELNKQSNRIGEIEETIEFVKAVDVKPSETDTVSVTVDKSLKGDFVVGANVKLSSDKSIIVSNGGLKADVSASFKKGTSTLFINVGNNEYAIDLSDLAVSVLKSAQYDASTEELVLEFIVGETTKTLRVPVGSLIHDVEVDDTDTVDMTLKSVSGGPNHISAEVKVDKTHSDNILTITSNGLYVAKAYITEAVKEEADARKAADDEIKATLANVSELANSNKEAIATEASIARAAEKANADAIAQEIKDARKAEEANANAIAENKTAIKANEVAIGAEEGRAMAAEQANATAITAEETRAMAAETKNASDINAEITRATEKEADLLGKIGINTEKINENKSAVVSEVERATKAEKEINDKAVANDAAIKAEVTRATSAESANATAIATETTRATTAEGELKADIEKNKTDIANAKAVADKAASDLSVEVSRATSAESANATAIATEKTRATTAEGELKTDVDKNKADISAANAAISNEVTRAKAVEADLTTKLTDETTRAKAAEAANATAVTTEKERAEHVESDLLAKTQENADNIATLAIEVGNIELKKEGGLSYALYVNGTKHGEFTIPKDQFLKSVNYNATTKELVFVFNTSEGETTTKVSIADLVDVYTAGDGLVLNGNTFSVNFTTVTSVEAMQAAVYSEATRAMAAESANAQSVVTEKERAMAAEGVNATAIATEKTRATTAEGELKADIEKNKTDIANAKAVADKAASDLVKEVERATAAETANTQAIATEKTRAMTAESVLDEKVNGANTAATNAQSVADKAASDLVKEIERATAAEQANAIAITKEISDARAAEAKVKSDIEVALATEKERAMTAEASNVAAINTEKERAIAAEGSNQIEISKVDAKVENVKNDVTVNATAIVEVAKDLASEVVRATTKEGELETRLTDTQDALTTTNTRVSANTTSISEVANNLASEVARATVKDANLESDVERALTSAATANTNADAAKASVAKIEQSLSNEVIRSTEKDAQLENAIASANSLINTKANSSDVYTQVEVLDKLSVLAKTSDVNTELGKKLNVTDAQNVYATKTALEEVKDTAATKTEVNFALAEKLNVTDAQNVYATKTALEEVKDTAAKTVDVEAKLSNKLNIVDAQNVYATKEEVQNVKDNYATTEALGEINSQLSTRIENNKESLDHIDFRFNNTTSELIYTDKNGNEHPFKLYGASLVKEGHFDAATNSIVLTIENSGVESYITIPVSELLSDLSGKIEVNAKAIEAINTELTTLAKKWDVNSSSSVELIKANDTLTANVLIASGTRQALHLNENGLFVSNDLQDSTCVYGEEGTVSGQDAISKLLVATTSISQELEKKLDVLDAQNTYATKVELQTLDSKVEVLKTDVTNNKVDISLIKKDVADNKEEIVESKDRIKDVEQRTTSAETRLTIAETHISDLEKRVTEYEKEINELKDTVNNITAVKLVEMTNAINALKSTVDTLAPLGGQIEGLLSEVSKIKSVTAYDTYTNAKNMSTRLDSLETTLDNEVVEEIDEIKNNLIGPKDGSVEGSVWNELNNMVDAGTF